MSFTVVLSSSAESYYRGLSRKAQARVRDGLVSLLHRPYQGKPLHGNLKGYYSLRVGKIRIVYRISEEDDFGWSQ